MPSGPTSGYVYTYYTYTTNTTDPDGDNVYYEFYWFDGTRTTVGPYASRTNASASHSWKKPINYQVAVRAKDAYELWSGWSSALSVILSQNDANIGGDAGNSFDAATPINPTSYKGTLYRLPTDTDDWYQFYAESGQAISVDMKPPEGVNFDLELDYPNNTVKAKSQHGAGEWESVGCTAQVSGNWRTRIFIPPSSSGEGQYMFWVTVYWPGGGCPVLYVYDGTGYYREGLLDIHNPDGTDVVRSHTLVSTPQRVDGAYLFQLVEHPKTHSYIDQVKLYATLEDGTTLQLPLIWAKHSEQGNVLPQLLLSDDWKTDTRGAIFNNGANQSIELKFAALSPNLKATAFTLQIEGNNMPIK